jgi:tRNA(fMet)-specific endonuclease VapC
MNGKHLLDTNIVIALLGGDVEARRRMENVEEAFISSVVLGELYFGAYKSAKVDDNLTKVMDFASSIPVLESNTGTARYYGQIKSELYGKGRPIPENDLWNAAIARQHGLIVLSRDDHFREIKNLEWEKW